MNYLTKEEMKMSAEEVNLQIALGIRSCETIGDVCKLLDDVREHERSLPFPREKSVLGTKI